MLKSKIYVFDIDGTICTNTNGEYEKAVQFEDVIEKVNKLYDGGRLSSWPSGE